MLRNEAGAEHLDALSCNLFDDGRIIEEPPAAEGHEVAELTRVDAQLVLVLATQHAYQETILRKSAAEIFERAQVRPANRVASQAQRRIHLRAHANHKRERKVEFAARRQDSFRQKTVAKRVRRIEKRIRKGNSHVHGAHGFLTIKEKAPDLGEGFSRSWRVHLIALRGKPLPVRRPVLENFVEPERGAKLRMLGNAV